MLRLEGKSPQVYSKCMATPQFTSADGPGCSPHEANLVERAQAGDAQAFGELYESLVDPVYRYIYFRVSDGITAEDLTSQVFLKAWEHLPHYRPQTATILAWAYTIAHHTVIDFYRVQHPTDSLDQIERLSSREPLPDAACESRLESDALQKALWQLTDEQREVIVMRLVDGMSTEEIAARLGKRPGAVRAAQMRGLQSLARILKEEPASQQGFPVIREA
jgi:RNA polymerase sigma-70 factor (ECF subfamily)